MIQNETSWTFFGSGATEVFHRHVFLQLSPAKGLSDYRIWPEGIQSPPLFHFSLSSFPSLYSFLNSASQNLHKFYSALYTLYVSYLRGRDASAWVCLLSNTSHLTILSSTKHILVFLRTQHSLLLSLSTLDCSRNLWPFSHMYNKKPLLCH